MNETAEPPWLVLRRAARSVHPAQRVRLSEMALEMLPEGHEQRALARLDLADALMTTGHQAEAAEIVDAVSREANRADVVVRSMTTSWFAAAMTSGACDVADELDAESLVSDFICEHHGRHLGELGGALADYALCEVLGGHALRARRTAQAALEASQSSRVRLATGMVQALAAVFDGELDAAEQFTADFMEVYNASPTQHDLMDYGPGAAESFVLSVLGSYESSSAAAAHGREIATIFGLPWVAARCVASTILTQLDTGHWTELLHDAKDEVLRHNRVQQGTIGGCVALVQSRCGNSLAAEQTLAASAEYGAALHSGLTHLLWARATQARLADDYDGAVAVFRELSSRLQARHVSAGWSSLILDAARTEWVYGDRAVARWWLSTLPRSSTSAHTMAFERAAAAFVRDNYLELEIAAMQLVNAPFEAAKLNVDGARSARMAGDRVVARRLAGRAVKTFLRLGAAGELRALERELRATGLTPSVPRVMPGGGATEVTEAERRVVGLVREGYSNKEIANRLGVSIRTVETHLSRVYSKLGVGSRLQLGTLRHEHWMPQS